MTLQVTEIIAKTNLFRALPPKLIEVIAACARPAAFSRGEMVFFEGDDCPGIYCVATGLVRVFKTAPNGKEHILHFASPGMTFAEVAVLGDFPCPAHAQASEETETVLIARAPFRQLLAGDPDLSFQLLGGMARWVHHLVGLLENIVLRDALSRVASSLRQAAKMQSEENPAAAGIVLFDAVLKKDLASHLNLTSETLSRTLRRLAELGLIDVSDQRRITILDAQKLDELASGDV